MSNPFIFKRTSSSKYNFKSCLLYTSGVVLEKGENGQAKILEAKTVENGCFVETGNDWERIQYAKEIVEKAVNLLDYFLEKYPDVERIGLTGQMHGIVYVDKEGNCVSPLYTWQDARGNICDGNQIPLTEEIRERCKIHAASGYGLVTHIYNIRHNPVSYTHLKFWTSAVAAEQILRFGLIDVEMAT